MPAGLLSQHLGVYATASHGGMCVLSGKTPTRNLFFSLVDQEYDEPILKHLQDIKVKFSDPGQPMVSTDSLSSWLASEHH